jgi:hypothetical protein
MIKSIGYNLFFIIFLLASVGAGLFFYNLKMLQPDVAKQNGKLLSLQGEVSQITNNLDRLKNQLDTFEKEKIDFSKVQSLGFFDSQDRVAARRMIDAIQKDSQLVNARYTIKPARNISNEKLREAGYKILETQINFDLEALNDIDIYHFINSLSNGFPGQLVIQDISFSRNVEVTQPLLRKIGSGAKEAIVKSSLNVIWQTMVPDENAQRSVDNNQGVY